VERLPEGISSEGVRSKNPGNWTYRYLW